MDELGVEPKTSCLQGRRATNYATRPNIFFIMFSFVFYPLIMDMNNHHMRRKYIKKLTAFTERFVLFLIDIHI